MSNLFKSAVVAFVVVAVIFGCKDVSDKAIAPHTAVQTAADSSAVAYSPFRAAAFTCGPFSGGYCTDWCTAKFNEIVSPSKRDWTGNAGDWFKNAQAKDWETSTDVTKGTGGAIAVFSGGGFGHVARCVDNYAKREVKDSKGKVTKTWYITLDEYNWGVLKTGATKQENDCYATNAITVNYGKQTSTQIESDKLTRGSYTFVGYIFPRKIKKK